MSEVKVMMKGDRKVAVVRPADPKKAMDRAKALVGTTDAVAFQAMLGEQDYRYVGLASECGRYVLDDAGQILGDVKPGDSFVDYEALQGCG